jgi:predicted lipoprotein with Yx(FWY)xxD motif
MAERQRRWPTAIVPALVMLLGTFLLAACGSGSASREHGDTLLELPVPATVTVQTRTLPGLGPILVDGQGRTLYMFPPDAGSRVTCTGPCAGTWPPLVIADGKNATAGKGVNVADLSTLADPNSGARIVTYSGFPLYRYAGDLQAGTANGQALFLNGGPWYVLTPGGQPVTSDNGADR